MIICTTAESRDPFRVLSYSFRWTVSLCPRGTEESVGLRRILSQSTESLNFRNRTLSMESLTDDGALSLLTGR